MPFTASLNVAINDVGSFCNIIIMVPYLIRILYGQLTPLEIIAAQKHLLKWDGGNTTQVFFSLHWFLLIFQPCSLLPPLIIICLYFSYRSVLTYTITILTIKTALMAAFILDFNRMSGVILFIENTNLKAFR